MDVHNTGKLNNIRCAIRCLRVHATLMRKKCVFFMAPPRGNRLKCYIFGEICYIKPNERLGFGVAFHCVTVATGNTVQFKEQCHLYMDFA